MSTRRLVLCLGLLTLLAGCRSREPQSGSAGESPAPATPSAPALDPGAWTFVFACPDSLRFTARVDTARAWVFLPDTTLQLSRVPAASGTKFTDGTTVFWSKGEEAVLERPGRTYRACRNLPAEAAWEHAKLTGMDFRALGNEPGWILEMGPQAVTLVADYGERTLEFPAVPPVEDPGDGSTRYVLTTDTDTLVVTLTPGPCFDGMSGHEFQTTVHLDLNGRVYRGCGNPLH